MKKIINMNAFQITMEYVEFAPEELVLDFMQCFQIFNFSEMSKNVKLYFYSTCGWTSPVSKLNTYYAQ